MIVLLDTGVLIRLCNEQDPDFLGIGKAIEALVKGGHTLCIGLQNACEFWCVATRPKSSRDGLGWSLANVESRLSSIEKFATLLHDTSGVYQAWRDLVRVHGVSGKNVYDTRLVACMICHDVKHIFTLNPSDFKRFKEITVLTLQDLIGSPTLPERT